MKPDGDSGDSALLTDLYQLTMLQAYFDQRMFDTAVFELFVRRLPTSRNFLVAAGLEQALDFLERLHFTDAELEFLARRDQFSSGFIDYLAQLRFTGDVHALPEGTLFFANEPLLRITAPLPEAQLVETRLLNLLHLQTLIASKAARMVLAGPDKLLVDFGLRRSHGAEAGLMTARASYLAGFSGTATVLAGQRFGIPLYGTMAHSFVQAHDSELVAFDHFAHSQPRHLVLLIDTYDTEAAAKKVVTLVPRLRADGIELVSVRIDSGDLALHARAVRKILDEQGLRQVRIFASSDIDEQRMAELLAGSSPIDGFGIGTRLSTCADAPYLDCAYKLQEYAGRARRKRSEGKSTWPGRKQVYRHVDAQGQLKGDTLTVESDRQDGQPLLELVMRGGHRLAPSPPLQRVRDHVRVQLAQLPAELRALSPAATPYPVEIAPALRTLAEQVDAWQAQSG